MQKAISQKLDTHKTDTRTIYRWRSAIGRWRKSVDSARHIDLSGQEQELVLEMELLGWIKEEEKES